MDDGAKWSVFQGSSNPGRLYQFLATDHLILSDTARHIYVDSQTKIPSFPCAKVCSNLFLSKHMTIYSSVERHNTILSLGCIQRESRLCRISMGSILFLEIIVHFHSGNCGCEEGRTCGVPSLDHLTPPIATHLVPHRHYR
jgi:hypothetical protein